MAVGRLVVCPPCRHQQACLTKDIEQAVTSQGDSRRLQLWLDQVVQLAGSNPWLPRTASADQRQRLGLVNLPSPLTVTGLIERLPTDAEMAASPCHAQVLETPLREDLPEGFFTTRTP